MRSVQFSLFISRIFYHYKTYRKIMIHYWLIMKTLCQSLNLIICHAISSLDFPPLPLRFPELADFLFVARPKGPPFVNAQRCDPLSTKHLKTEWGWKNMKNMRRDMRARWRWRTLKRVELDMEHLDRLEIGRISHICTPQYPASDWQSQNLKPWYEVTTPMNGQSVVLVHTEGKQDGERHHGWTATEVGCILFLFTQLDCSVFAAVSPYKSLAMDPLWWCGELRHPSSHFCFCCKLFFLPAEHRRMVSLRDLVYWFSCRALAKSRSEDPRSHWFKVLFYKCIYLFFFFFLHTTTSWL